MGDFQQRQVIDLVHCDKFCAEPFARLHSNRDCMRAIDNVRARDEMPVAGNEEACSSSVRLGVSSTEHQDKSLRNERCDYLSHWRVSLRSPSAAGPSCFELDLVARCMDDLGRLAKEYALKAIHPEVRAFSWACLLKNGSGGYESRHR